MHHHSMAHNGPLVLLSFAVALLASYTALDMGTRLRHATGKARRLWLGGSAVVLGGGIWSMHFIAMLAFDAGVPIGYDFGVTALSLLIAIGIVAIGFQLVTRRNPSIARQVAAGCVVGCGVAAMHYTGMGALIVSGTVRYDPLLVMASILVAIVAATAALWLTLHLTRSWQRFAAAAVMALAVCGMHYTAMAATYIDIEPARIVAVDPLSRWVLAGAVSLGTFLILCLALVCVFFDRRLEFLAEREAERLRAANASLTEAQGAMGILLDNADQGFLTIGPDLLVGLRSSASCEAILGEAPARKPIIDLLCRPDSDTIADTLRITLESVFRESGDFVRDLKVGLIPTEFAIDGRSIKASYKYLADRGRLMVILTDVTETTRLTEELERERQRLEMAVLAFTEGEAFASLVDDFRHFLRIELPEVIACIGEPGRLDHLYRRLHTYKGLLAQFSFLGSPRRLHEIETRLSMAGATLPAKPALFGRDELLAELELDLAGVTEILGSDVASGGRRAVLSQNRLRDMERTARSLLDSAEGRAASAKLRGLLQTLADLSLRDVKAALVLHGRGAIALAARLGKQLAPIQVEGDEASLPPERYDDFCRSLVHVFRNAVDHGIEGPEERLRAGKSPEGSIRCALRVGGGWLEILIEDDGRGVDRLRLANKLVAAGHPQPPGEDLSLEELVFRDGLSSRETATEVSGRGVGMAAVKVELERLGGSVTVESEAGVGTRFRFRLPTGPDTAACERARLTSSTDRITT